jgi:UDP-N-acetylmuramoyl-tripeptide--D-alanyl-D-alanine ligase
MRIGGTVVEVPLPGRHNLANAVLAMAVARVCGVADADAARGIANVKLPPMRSAVQALGDALLVNDAYNANPASMRAALDMLSAAGKGRPLVAVLGTMREMGNATAPLHDDIARAALASDVVVIGAVGEFAAAFERVSPGNPRVTAAADPESLWPRLEPRLERHAAILLKGSRGVRLERLVPHLELWAGVAQRTAKTS